MIVGLLCWISLQIWVLGYLNAWVSAQPQDRRVVHMDCLWPLIAALLLFGYFYIRGNLADQRSGTTFERIGGEMD